MNRPAKEHRFLIPSREDIISRLQDLIQERSSRDIVADWSSEYIIFDEPQIYPEIEDVSVWEAIKLLSSADLKIDTHTYLYGITDFQLWLDEFETKET